MAKHAHTTPTSTPSPSRRSLFGGAAAVIIGSGVTAGAAASVADLVPASPDAELIDLCSRFDAIEREHYAVFASARDDDAQTAAMAAMGMAHDPLLDRIIELPPTTLAGAVALAKTLDQWTHGDFARNGGTDDMLAHTLIRGLAGRA